MSFYIQGKGYFEDSGRPIGSKRKVDLMRANVYGKQNDSQAFTRLVCESRVSRQLLTEAFRRGFNAMNPIADSESQRVQHSFFSKRLAGSNAIPITAL